MTAFELISHEIPPLKPTDTCAIALDWMAVFKVNHLAIVENKKLVGIICDDDILDANKPTSSIGICADFLINVSVNKNKHVYELMRVMSENNLSVLPVTDDKGKYLGVATASSILHKISNISSFHMPGSVVILEMNIPDYSLLEIARIVEAENGSVLSSFVSSDVVLGTLELTLKINKEDISGILQAFERFNYTILASFQNSVYDENLRERYDEFMNFINM